MDAADLQRRLKDAKIVDPENLLTIAEREALDRDLQRIAKCKRRALEVSAYLQMP